MRAATRDSSSLLASSSLRVRQRRVRIAEHQKHEQGGSTGRQGSPPRRCDHKREGSGLRAPGTEVALSDDFESVGTLAQVWKAGLSELSFNPFGLGTLQTVTKTRVVFVNKSQRCESHTEGPVLVADIAPEHQASKACVPRVWHRR